LLGTMFTILYAVVGVPFGRLADSWSRKKLLALGMLVWGALTAGAALVTSYGMLVVTRLGVGVGGYSGEAALSVGFSRQLSPKANLTFGAAVSGNEASGGVGVGIGW